MANISPKEAIEFAELHFPNAPEKLAQYLGIEVRSEPMNSDGWCLQLGDRKIIRINGSHTLTRRRFTLAHELGHLILGILSDAGESVQEAKRSRSADEAKVDDFASAILLPERKTKSFVHAIPVTSADIKRIAKRANVSELSVALRLAALDTEIGLKAGLVAFYQDGIFKWQRSNKATFRSGLSKLLDECLKQDPAPFRYPRPQEKDVIVASVIDNPYFHYQAVFAQFTSEEKGMAKTDGERTSELEKVLYQGDKSHQQSFNGCLSTMKGKIAGMDLDDAVQLFIDKYLVKPNEAKYWNEWWDSAFRARLLTSTGREYIRLKLSRWING